MSDDPIITHAMLRAQDQERIAKLEGLLREAAATLEMWRDVAPAYSLSASIRAALGEKP